MGCHGGRCCAKENAPTQSLSCAISTDKITYLVCSSKPPARKSSSILQAKPATKKASQVKNFPHCEGTDHLYKSLLKCPYNGASKKPKLCMEEDEEATADTEHSDDENLLSTNFIH
eukprot:15365350-Ditylum_brightwellii.AAC.1